MQSVPKGTAGITLNSYNLRPKSRGTVTLGSADPRVRAVVDPNFLSHPDDLRISAEGVRQSYEMFNQPAMRKHIRTIQHFDRNAITEDSLREYARKFGRTSYHPTCTCKMGVDDMAVVDPYLRVRGVEGLRICDSSVMPSIVGSNTNAATVMIGERAAEFIRGNS